MKKVTQLCSHAECLRPIKANGFCNKHWSELDRRRRGIQPRNWRGNKRDIPCSVEGCNRISHAKKLCLRHYLRLRKNGHELKLKNAPPGSGHLCKTHGYRIISVRGVQYKEHRWVMEKTLGRELMTNESVHHKNGDRADNRAENLELWSSSQPAGQRVEDKVSWALELLKFYAPQSLAIAL